MKVDKVHIDGIGCLQITDPGPNYTHIYIDILEHTPPLHLPKDKEAFLGYLEDAALLLDAMSEPKQIKDISWLQHHSFSANAIGMKYLMDAMWLLFYVGGYHGRTNQNNRSAREVCILKVLNLWWGHN